MGAAAEAGRRWVPGSGTGGNVSNRFPHPSVALFSPDGRDRTVGKFVEANLSRAFDVRWCRRIDEFSGRLRETHVGVVCAESRWDTAVRRAVAELPVLEGRRALVFVSEGDRMGRAAREERKGRASSVILERLSPWQIPGALIAATGVGLIRSILDRCQQAILGDQDLATRSPFLHQALVRVFEVTELPIVEVQKLPQLVSRVGSVSVRSLQISWKTGRGGSDLSLKDSLRIVVLLRAILLHLERPEMSWSECALETSVAPRTLRRYMKRHAGATPSQLRRCEIPGLAAILGCRLEEALR